jgi:OOP family OmpA-OmpF porin
VTPGGREQFQQRREPGGPASSQQPVASPTPTPTPTAAPLVREQLQKREPGGPAQSQQPVASPTPTPTPTAAPLVREQLQKREPGGVPSQQTAPSTTAAPTGTKQPLPVATPTPTATPTLLPGGIPTNPGAPRTQSGPAGGATTAPAGTTPAAGTPAAPSGGPNSAAVPAGPNSAAPPGKPQNAPPTVTPAFQRAPQITQPLPAAPALSKPLAPIAPGAVMQGPSNLSDFRGQRREVQQGGRTVITEPGRIIIRDPGGQEYVRHNEMDRFQYGARDIRTEVIGGETRTVVIRPDGSEIITVIGPDGQLLRRIRRDDRGREIIIIDNSYRDPRTIGGFYVDLPPPVVRIPYDRYIVDSEYAEPEVIYDTMIAPPVDRVARRYTLDEIRYSPNVRQLMPSIDLNTITFETGSWEIPPDQAAKLQVIADGLNRAIQRNPREVFLIEGHTDAVGNDTDNLSLSDRRAESAATLLTQQFGVPAENLTSQGYGSQYLKEQTSGPSRINRRVTIRRITPLLNGGQASLPPPPPGIAPPR